MSYSIKFFTVPHNHPQVRYQHELVALAEGLKEIGHSFFSSDDYWMVPGKDYLLKKADGIADVNIYTAFYFRAFPEKIGQVDYSKINILIDREDGLYGEYCNPKYKRFDLILRTHYNKNINYKHYHHNVRPWAFGLSNRIIEAIDETKDLPVESRVLVNFRISHDLRKIVQEKFTPFIKKKYPVLDKITPERMPAEMDKRTDLYWQQSGKRHDPEYYKMMNSSLLTYTFGGFIYPLPFAYNRILKQVQKLYSSCAKILNVLGRDHSGCYFIDQFDSWRLWEAFYSQTCPVHMDFENQGWILPVMPENKVHYWGVKGFNFRESAGELLSLQEKEIGQIGANGREWSIQHYSPLSTAKRFLNLISELKKSE